MAFSSSPSPNSFDINVVCYDAMINWPRRLARESPFYRKWLADCNAKRVLDVACGTGHHAMMFHDWSLSVEAADASAAMIAHCRSAYGIENAPHWIQRSFIESTTLPNHFDAVVCVGNSLALADSEKTIRLACKAMLEALRVGGICILHLLNLWSRPEGPTSWQKCMRIRLKGEEHLLLKGIHRSGEQGFIDFADLLLGQDESVTPRFDSTSFLGIEADTLADFVAEAGGETVAVFGDYKEAPYDRLKSTDLILIGRKIAESNG